MTPRHIAGNCETQKTVLPVSSCELQTHPAAWEWRCCSHVAPAACSRFRALGGGDTASWFVHDVTQTLPDNGLTQVGHMALSGGGWVPLRKRCFRPLTPVFAGGGAVLEEGSLPTPPQGQQQAIFTSGGWFQTTLDYPAGSIPPSAVHAPGISFPGTSDKQLHVPCDVIYLGRVPGTTPGGMQDPWAFLREHLQVEILNQ